MTREEAQHLIDTYCEEPPLNGTEARPAVERLMGFNKDDFAKLHEPDSGKVQDRLDDILYGNILVHYGTTQTECGLYPMQFPKVYTSTANHNDVTCPPCVSRLLARGYWMPGSMPYNERKVLSAYP